MTTYAEIAELLRGRRCGRGREGLRLEGDCWVFCGALDSSGYGNIHRAEFRGKATRYVWLKFVGPIPPDMQILHTCDRPACVRPDHLWMGTHTDNMRDMFAKGRGRLPDATLGTAISREVRMTTWTAEQRSAAARHASAARTLAKAPRKDKP